ncbi:MAG TPA: type III pantothenate kinase [Candidatus Limnocylindria bacterium]|nr:type III pantothenate kinase [Candidatus Limnocylindria bacterium]
MLVAIDIGNTNITFAAFEAGVPGEIGRTPTDAGASAADLSGALGELADAYEFVVASVVPALTERIAELAGRRGARLLVADHTNVPIGVGVERPAEVGADRLVNAFAALRLHGAPAVIVDFGTATTFDVLDADGAYAGGAIAPGLQLSVEALAERTAQLPNIVLAAPPHAIGRNTLEAMQSGAVLGYLGLVRTLIEAIRAELAAAGAPPPRVILTGGLSAAPWATAIAGVTAIDPALTLRGLALLHAELRASAGVRAAAP